MRRCPCKTKRSLDAAFFGLLLVASSVFAPCQEVASAQPAPQGAKEKEEEFIISNFDIEKGRIVFSYARSPKDSDIYVLDFTELSVRPVVKTTALDEVPNWSPDGRKIVFHSDATGDREIYVVNEDGSDLVQLTSSPGADENPAWSPDGKQIVFQTRRRKNGADLYVMNADGSNQRAILENGQRNVCPSWSPRNDEIVFSTDEVWPGWVLKVLSLSNKKSTLLTRGQGAFVRPGWFPDGGAIVFSYGGDKDQLGIFSAEKGRELAVTLVRRPGQNLDASWDDAGRYLFFAGEQNPGAGDFQLYFYDKTKPPRTDPEAGTEVVQVMKSKGAVRHPSWTPLPSVSTLQKMRKIEKK